MNEEESPGNEHEQTVDRSPALLHRRYVLSQKIDYELCENAEEDQTATVDHEPSRGKIAVVKSRYKQYTSCVRMYPCQKLHKILETFPGEFLKFFVEFSVKPSRYEKR